MSIADTKDILGYFADSRIEHGLTVITLGELLDREPEPLTRWPVRNREPREPIDSQKRAIIHERDGGECQYCWRLDRRLVLDHIIPRSAYEAKDLKIADRSDNLQSACWECNEYRSNYDAVFTKRLGVAVKCWYCVFPEYEGDDSPDLPCDVNIPVFCGRCGVSYVPSVAGWVL